MHVERIQLRELAEEAADRRSYQIIELDYTDSTCYSRMRQRALGALSTYLDKRCTSPPVSFRQWTFMREKQSLYSRE